MELIKNFGINPYLLFGQIVNFLILLYLLKRFAFKPILQLLEKRRKDIDEGLRKAEEGRQALAKAIEEEKKIFKKAQQEAQKILTDAKNQADQIAEEMKYHAKEQVTQMLKDAEEQRNREEKELEKRIALSAAKLAVTMVHESIKNVFTQEEQEETIKKLARNLKVQRE